MKIGILPADKGGCGLHRMINPAKAVHNLALQTGQRVEVVMADNLVAKYSEDMTRIVDVPNMDIDVLVLQRVMSTELLEAIPLVQEQGVAVVVELDDDIERTAPSNAAYKFVSPRYNPRSNWVNLRKACALADLVTVSTPALRRYAPHGRVQVIPNRIPRAVLSLADLPVQSPRRVGWAGSVETHPFDLQVTQGGVARALSSTQTKFRVLGEGTGVREALGLAEDPDRVPWTPIHAYPPALHDSFEIGIVPLDRTTFNEGKSALKGLEMAAVGIPYVATPTAEYQRVCEEYSIGVLARRGRDWERQLRKLITSDSYWDEVRSRSLAGIRSAYVLEDHAHEWLDAWRSARSIRVEAVRS